MNELTEVRRCNKRIYELSQELMSAREYAYPKAISYDNIGGSHGGSVDAIERAYIRVDEVITKMIRVKRKRARLVSEIKRAAYRAELDEREWFVIKMIYIVTKETEKPYTWQEVIHEMQRLYHIKERQAYNIHSLARKKILDILD